MPPRPAARLQRFFAPGGTLSRAHSGWEPRAEQEAMASEVLATLEEGGHLLVEAGTGIGKTLAYLVPAVLSGKVVVVSTGTKALQDQIALKDAPFLAERCGLKFVAVTLKGRDNYLCRHRHALFRAHPVLAPQEAGLWPEVDRWALETHDGDLAALSHLPESPVFWDEINAKSSTCLGQRCPEHETCHLQEVRRRAESADVIIVNHHLFLADATVRHQAFGRVLPDADAVIFDEAHKLEAAATTFFGRTVSNWRLRELADDVVRELPKAGVQAPLVLRRADELRQAAALLPAAWSRLDGRAALPATLPAAQQDALDSVLGAARSLGSALGALATPPPEIEPFARRTRELVEDLELLHARSDDGQVFWVETRGRGLFLTATPVDIAPLARERIFQRLRASVLCSATLAVGGTMAHVRARLGLQFEGEEAPVVRESVHASPFDYATQGLLYLPRGVPEPKSGDFAASCAEVTRSLLDASRGRAFLLFTSFENLRRVHEILRHDSQWPLLVQGEAQKHELLRRFREQEGSVLFATSSFWEGVDVAGEALSLVVIDKLPFGVPTDPIFSARARLVEDRGGDPFRELSVPEAVLTLKQGVGRLIRSASDRGVVAILDPRVATTQYGRIFLANLPPFRRTRELEHVREFFGRETGPARTGGGEGRGA